MSSQVYQTVTDRIVSLLERGTVPWRRPWGASGGVARNYRGTAYRGINALILPAMGYESPCWLTYKQAQEAGGNVRRGEKATPVVFWKIERKPTGETNEHGEPVVRVRPIGRLYHVFNLAQTENVPEPEWSQAHQKPETFQAIGACEEIVEAWDGRPEIEHGGDRACYRPVCDRVTMPARERFESPEAYYSVLFHELGHSTGHKSRLDREGITDLVRFRSHAYSKEELVAETTAAFLSARAGIDRPEITENQAAYLESWIRVLRGDARLVVQAAAKAQKAADLILGEKAEKRESGASQAA